MKTILVTNSYCFASPDPIHMSNWSIYTLGYIKMLQYQISHPGVWQRPDKQLKVSNFLLSPQISLFIENLHQRHYICKQL
jgi:hypothetical protein